MQTRFLFHFCGCLGIPEHSALSWSFKCNWMFRYTQWNPSMRSDNKKTNNRNNPFSVDEFGISGCRYVIRCPEWGGYYCCCCCCCFVYSNYPFSNQVFEGVGKSPRIASRDGRKKETEREKERERERENWKKERRETALLIISMIYLSGLSFNCFKTKWSI